MTNQNTIKDQKDQDQYKWYKIIRNIALLSALFTFITSALLIINYLQSQRIDLLNIQTIEKLVTQLEENPDNQVLKEQIRVLDLLSRKAFFTEKWQTRTGGYLLFVFILGFLLSIKYLNTREKQFPDLSEDLNISDNWKNKLLSGRIIIVGGITLFLSAFAAGIMTEQKIDNYNVKKKEKTVKTSKNSKPSENKIKTENWPGFRGPSGTGISYNKEIPDKWDGKTGENILWKIPVKLPGYNSPIVWENKVLLSGADRKNQIVYCFDTSSGKTLWEKKVENVKGSPKRIPKPSNDTGYAAATMCTDGKQIYVIFATGDVAGLDMDGNVKWSRNLGAPKNHYGHSSSLITYKNILLIQYDQNTGGRLVGLDIKDGSVIYDQKREVSISWASPILVNTGKRHELILSSNPLVMSHDPQTGKILWSVKCMSGEVGPSPGYSNGIIFAVNEYATLAAIKPGNPAKVIWEYDDSLSEVSSPVVTDKYLYMAASYGAVTCFDVKTGKKLWEKEYDQGFYSSPIIAEDKVYLIDTDGVTMVFKADNKFEQISQNPLGEKVVSTPAFKNKKIFIRSYKHLFCIGNN